MIEIFNNENWQKEHESEEFKSWKEELINLTIKLNFDAVVELALYLAYNEHLNDQ